MPETLNVDYLVIGAGAMGMAFADTILSDTEKTIVIVDRYSRPSGHWTVAYPFVRLHQPSVAYGVNSKNLGQNLVDKVGWNKGHYELASRDEIRAYYDSVMYQTFLPSGRVTYFPKHEYTGGQEFHSILTGKTYQVGKETRIVDSTYMNVQVPSMRPPPYEVAEGVEIVAPNNVPNANRPHANYTIVGGGKTGIDVILYLLANDIDPDNITWVVPRDSLFMNRGNFQPGEQGENFLAVRAATFECILAASSIDDLLKRLVACGQLLQLDDKVWPTMYHAAILSVAELEQLRRIKSIIRHGRIRRITRDEVFLEHGSYTPNSDSLYIDCTANCIANSPETDIFQDDKIRLQPVYQFQQVFSSAFIAHVEASYPDNDTKNKFCRVVSFPNATEDLPGSSMFAPGIPKIMVDFGHTRLYIWGNILLTIFTVGVALSQNMAMMVAFRFLMGLAGAVPITIGSGSIADIMPVELHGRAMSAWDLGPLLGPRIRPVAGGYLNKGAG
ncbi:hypothetical protein EsH8_IV_000005 [Colletotrichum jinshuiense]